MVMNLDTYTKHIQQLLYELITRLKQNLILDKGSRKQSRPDPYCRYPEYVVPTPTMSR